MGYLRVPNLNQVDDDQTPISDVGLQRNQLVSIIRNNFPRMETFGFPLSETMCPYYLLKTGRKVPSDVPHFSEIATISAASN